MTCRINPCVAGLVLYQFGSDSCAPCHAIRRRIEAWLPAHPGVRYQYLSLEEHPEEAAQNEVFSVPALLLYAEGKLVLRECGYFSVDAVLEKAIHYEQLLSQA